MKLLLAKVKGLRIPAGDVEKFQFLVRYERKLHGQTRTVQLTKDVLNEKIKLHRQWMQAVENMPKDTPCHAHTNKRMAYRADLEQIRVIALPADER